MRSEHAFSKERRRIHLVPEEWNQQVVRKTGWLTESRCKQPPRVFFSLLLHAIRDRSMDRIGVDVFAQLFNPCDVNSSSVDRYRSDGWLTARYNPNSIRNVSSSLRALPYTLNQGATAPTRNRDIEEILRLLLIMSLDEDQFTKGGIC